MTDRLLYITDAIVYSINWPIMFYVLCGVALLTFFMRFLDLSPLHVAVAAIREILSIFREGGPANTRSMIDGILTVAGVLFTAIMAIPFVSEESSQYIEMLKTGVLHEHQAPYLFILMFFATCIATIISLWLTR